MEEGSHIQHIKRILSIVITFVTDVYTGSFAFIYFKTTVNCISVYEYSFFLNQKALYERILFCHELKYV